MLEVKNLYREYKPKKGDPVVALNGVNLKFPDKGLIFVLGKSGSGKSTLLNVMGGLDKYDNGEIIIKGKSSKDFKQKDFDAYRNTYLGFIFQEYNILDEFNVGQNIALALELQGKKATSDEINRILEEVDLVGYGKRKTNELSGGQKQRVAIARALVKSPEIIFADEPTGALDSKTGKAVFDTLKKLSLNKLVIVVSHDRDFAEYFGDRVIELSDGKVISDIEKIKVAGEAKSEGVTIIEDKVIKIDKGYVLTTQDMKIIQEYLNKTTDERLISLDGGINTNVRSVARIDDGGNKESFKTTDEGEIVNKPSVFQTIKSALSLKHCFRIGASSLKIKPFRLFLTILLSITAFGMFGLADTMGSYDKVTATINSIGDTNIKSLAFEKNVVTKWEDYTSTNNVNCNEEDVSKIKEKYGLEAEKIYNFNSYRNMGSYQISSFSFGKTQSSFYPIITMGMYVATPETLEEKNFTLVKGTYPIQANEVAITKVIYDSFAYYGYEDYMNSDNNLNALDVTMDKIVGRTILVDKGNGYSTFTISGIIDTNFAQTAYEKLKEPQGNNGMSYYMLMQQYEYDYKYDYHTLLFTNQQTIEKEKKNTYYSLNNYAEVNINDSYDYYCTKVSTHELLSYNLFKNGKTKVSKNETLISFAVAQQLWETNKIESIEEIEIDFGDYTMTVDSLNGLMMSLHSTNFIYKFAKETYDQAIENGMDIVEIQKLLKEESKEQEISREEGIRLYANYINMLELQNNPTLKRYVDIDYLSYYSSTVSQILKPYIDKICEIFSKITVNLSVYDPSTYDKVTIFSKHELECVGLQFSLSEPTLIIDKETYDENFKPMGDYSFLMVDVPSDKQVLKNMIFDYYNPSTKVGSYNYSINSELTPAFSNVNDLIENLANIFIYVGIGFAVFASLMLFNFISISISYKKREIGILRAVGARSKDVFNIFFAESFIISMISYVFAIVITISVSIVINHAMRTNFGLPITILSPGVRQILLVLLVCLFVAFVSSFVPVYNIAMKRPIDAIKDR